MRKFFLILLLPSLCFGGITTSGTSSGGGGAIETTSDVLKGDGAGGASALGSASGIPAFLATPTSANLATAITNETGSGSLVFGTSPTLGTPTIAGTTGLLLVGATGGSTFADTNGVPSSTQLEHFVRLSNANNNVLALQNTSATGYTAMRLVNELGYERGAFGFGNTSSGGVFNSSTFIESSTSSGSPPPIKFVQSVIGTSNTVVGQFDSAGAFSVAGSATITGALAAGTSSLGALTISANLANTNVLNITDTATNGYSAISFRNASNVEKMYVGHGNSTAGSFTNQAYIGTASGTTFVFNVNGAENARMTAGGGFGIGTTTDPGAGNIAINGGLIKNATVQWKVGSGSPEGAVTAAIGSVYSRTDGGASTSFYVKESGASNTGWVAK